MTESLGHVHAVHLARAPSDFLGSGEADVEGSPQLRREAATPANRVTPTARAQPSQNTVLPPSRRPWTADSGLRRFLAEVTIDPVGPRVRNDDERGELATLRLNRTRAQDAEIRKRGGGPPRR